MLDDLCAYRGARLIAGTVDGECLRCPYHSCAYADDGRCTHIPQLAADRVIPRDARVESFRTSEHGGLIWTCLVDEASELRPRPTWPVAEAGTHWLHVVGTRFEYRLELPFTVALGGASGPGTVMCVGASPMSVQTMKLFWLCAFPLGVEVDAGAYEALESRIWLPDRAAVEGQRPERLPLDLLEEVHLPFDRLAIAYRRRLREIGFALPGGAVMSDAATG